MQTVVRHHKRIMQAVRVGMCMALILIMLLAGLPFAPRTAYAVTSAEKQAEADEMVRQLDALQTEISRINRELDDATAAQEAASLKMQDAKEREDAAIARTAELQRQLAERAVEAYRNKTPTYLDVLFGASSFSEFISSWDMINRLNVHDTQLTQNSKDIRKEAESARQLYNEQERIIAEKKAEIASLKVEMEEKSAEMQAEIVRLNEEAAELLAQEEAAAEAARLAAAAAAIANGSLTPEQIAALPKFIHPCPSGVFTSGFGYRDFDHSFHMGLDLGAPTGTPIYAVAAGTVIISGYSSSAGNWVVISHGSGLVTKYMHASALYVTAGQSVSAGETIAAVGNTGNSFGAHLHFQVEIGGTAVNPLPFL